MLPNSRPQALSKTVLGQYYGIVGKAVAWDTGIPHAHLFESQLPQF